LSRVTELFREPLKVNAWLIVFAFGSMFLLPSQTASALVTYLLGVAMLVTLPRWRGYLAEPILLLSVVLTVYLVLSSFWSQPPDWDKARSMAVKGLSTLLFLAAFAECWQLGIIQRWLGRALVVCGGGAAIVAIVYFLVTNPEDGRMNGLGQLGAHVIAGLLFGVVLIYLLQSLKDYQSVRWRVIAGICAAVLVSAIVLTFSRNAWASVLGGLVVYGAASVCSSRGRFVLMVSVFALTGMLGLGLLYLSDAGHEFLLPRGDSFRPLIWSTIFERVWEHDPVFGMGLVTPDDVVNGPFIHPHPHSMYLAVLYQGGLVGLSMFLALIVLTVRSLLLHFDAPIAKVALASLTVGLLSYLLDGHELVDRIGETWLLFWLPVAISAALQIPQQTRAPSGYPLQHDPS